MNLLEMGQEYVRALQNQIAIERENYAKNLEMMKQHETFIAELVQKEQGALKEIEKQQGTHLQDGKYLPVGIAEGASCDTQGGCDKGEDCCKADEQPAFGGDTAIPNPFSPQ